MTVHADALLPAMQTDRELTEQLVAPIGPGQRWLSRALLVCGAITALFALAMAYTFLTGIGTWGNDIPVGWAFGITNFVWWIGIGHAGTFISAILLLLQQKWRTSINRIAEGMTLFAVAQAGLFPLLHLGRAWFFYWLVPYPSTMGMWPQFMSALAWDIAAISTYLTISVLFWYLGTIPDLAARRDRSVGRARAIYAVVALGWRGSSHHWRHYKAAQLLLAGLATPLVISVHSVVSTDFATGILPGWHSTIFPPYFVAGAIFSGFAMVLTLVIPMRRYLGLKSVITPLHLDMIAKLTLVTSLIVTFSYLVEHFMAYYSGEWAERHMFFEVRPFGPYAPVFWTMIVCNCVVPLTLASSRVRASTIALWIISILVNVGMWAERLVLIVTSQHRDFLPSSFGIYHPSVTDVVLFVGSLGFFLFLFLLLLRFVPFIPISELKEMKREIARERAVPRSARADVAGS